jgi:hypothetical protein
MSSSFGDNKRKPGAGASAVTEARRLAALAATWTFPSKGPRVTSGSQVAAATARNAGVLALKYAEQNGSVYIPPESGAKSLTLDLAGSTIDANNNIYYDYTVPDGTTTLTLTLTNIPTGYGDAISFVFGGITTDTGGDFKSLVINGQSVSPIVQNKQESNTTITTDKSVSNGSVLTITADQTFGGSGRILLSLLPLSLTVDFTDALYALYSSIANFNIPVGIREVRLTLTNVPAQYGDNTTLGFSVLTNITGGEFTNLVIDGNTVSPISQTHTANGTLITTSRSVSNNATIIARANKQIGKTPGGDPAGAISLYRKPAQWTVRTEAGSKNWGGVASSTTGQYLVAFTGGDIYLSENYGSTWVSIIQSARTCLTVLRPTQNDIFILFDDRLTYSTDGGSNFTEVLSGGSEPFPADTSYIALFGNGTTTEFRLVAASGNTGNLRRSILPYTNWVSIATSSLGSYVRGMVVSEDGQSITVQGAAAVKTNTTLNDFGTWRDSGITIESGQQIQDVAASTDATKIVVAVYGGGIWRSDNRGSSFTKVIESNESWNTVASSGNGSILVAAPGAGGIQTSVDSGEHWTQSTTAAWNSVASSQDGTRLVAVTSTYIYTATEAPIPGGSGEQQAPPPEMNGQIPSEDGPTLA